MGDLTPGQIQSVNDQLRKSLCSVPAVVPEDPEAAKLDEPIEVGAKIKGRLMLTRGFADLEHNFRVKAIDAVKDFNNFNETNDPHGEHDYAIIEVDGEKIMFKFDCYDKDMMYYGHDCHVLYIMLPHER